MFFSFDGIDGAGKSSQIERLVTWLEQRGQTVVVCRDPGSTPLGEQLRSLLLDLNGPPIGAMAEMLLYMSARAQLVESVIKPALDTGQSVVTDRFLLANVVYQGHAGGITPPAIWKVGQIATLGIEPDMTFLLDITPEAAAQRLQRTLDRIEDRGDEFRQRLRAGYLTEASRMPNRIAVIDASRDVDAIHADVITAAERAMAQSR